MVLLAVCDAKYCFSMFDVDQYGSNNDSAVLLNSKLGKKIAQGLLNIPSGTTINGCALNLFPIFLLGLTRCEQNVILCNFDYEGTIGVDEIFMNKLR